MQDLFHFNLLAHLIAGLHAPSLRWLRKYTLGRPYRDWPPLSQAKLILGEKRASIYSAVIAQGQSHIFYAQAESLVEQLMAANVSLLTIDDANYPEILKEITDPPEILYVQGKVTVLKEPQIAIVGSRNCTPGGIETAYQFAKELALAGITVTSGLARGIDAAAHRGALDGEGYTAAVMGVGSGRIYPHANRGLAEQIADQGALITEFLPGSAPAKANFPRRNRIIAGLSMGTLVVEATLRSGSLITARQALEFDRDVFAIPGSINNPGARGCHSLIRQGAVLTETVADVLQQVDVLAGSYLGAKKASQIELAVDEKSVLNAIGYELNHVDTIQSRCDVTAANLHEILLNLELKGLVCQHGGAYQRL